MIGPLQSKCLNKDDYKNGVTASTGGKFNVGWVFQNNGKHPWPEDVKLDQVSGDSIGLLNPYSIKRSIHKDKKITMHVDFQAPNIPGKYHAFFRLKHSNDIPFGDQVMIDLYVVKPGQPLLQLD